MKRLLSVLLLVFAPALSFAAIPAGPDPNIGLMALPEATIPTVPITATAEPVITISAIALPGDVTDDMTATVNSEGFGGTFAPVENVFEKTSGDAKDVKEEGILFVACYLWNCTGDNYRNDDTLLPDAMTAPGYDGSKTAQDRPLLL